MGQKYIADKNTTTTHYTFLFSEVIFEEYIGGSPLLYLSSEYFYYSIEQLEKKILEVFGKAKKEIKYYKYVISRKANIIDEEALVYDDFIIFIKNKNSVDIFDELEEEEEGGKSEIERIKIDLFGKENKEIVRNNFEKVLFEVSNKIKRKPSEISILCNSQFDGFYLKNVKTISTQVNLKDNYNDGFEEVSDYILQRLNSYDDKGIVFLHGPAGTGKTSYLRYLTNKITSKQIIYIPPDFAINISNPEFITFFLSHTNSILIIEDAENILKSRKAGGNQTVANLLSVSDGLLGDGLKLQIICTFNSPIIDIDSALMRDGRLIAEYKFEELTQEKAQSLMTKLCLDKQETEVPVVTQSMTLAEVYNFKDKKYKSKEKSAIGFNRK